MANFLKACLAKQQQNKLPLWTYHGAKAFFLATACSAVAMNALAQPAVGVVNTSAIPNQPAAQSPQAQSFQSYLHPNGTGPNDLHPNGAAANDQNNPPPPATVTTTTTTVQPTQPSATSAPAADNVPMTAADFAQAAAGTTTTTNSVTVTTPVQPVPAPTIIHIPRPARPRNYLSYQEGQRLMLNSVPPTGQRTSPDDEYAFRALLQQNMPLTPRQVVRLHQQIDLAQRAAAIPANVPPKPVSTTLMVNLAPGTTPPAVRLAYGYVSSLVFVDSTGAPWPIAAFDIGNPKALNIQWDGKSNILLMQAVSPYSDGNMVIRLVGLPTPITLELVSGQRQVDYRVDIHVSGLGPNTKDLPMGTALPGSANELLLGVLDGVAPAGSRALSVLGADAQAWILGDKMYLRTRLTVLSPGWVGKMVSPDGMQAYELPRTSSVLVSRYGEPAELKIEGF